ncbi:hypothetical protein [Hymenobacter sp. B81]|uniref:hypothetical protein n=1 Tax=Hymenobacter sp. B81 TaxID=3344878 RepID=UPI0037DD415C
MNHLRITSSNASAAPIGPVNLIELKEVDSQHLPGHLTRFAPLDEIRRVGRTVKRQKPHLTEEVDFRIADIEVARAMQEDDAPLSVAY